MVANKRDALWFPKQEDSCNAAIDWDVIFICALSTENIVPTVSSNKTLPRSFKFKDPSETDRCLLNNVSSINQIFYGDWGYNQIKKYLPVLISTSFLSKSWKRVLYFICVSNVHVCVHVFSFDANWPNSLKKSGVQTSEMKQKKEPVHSVLSILNGCTFSVLTHLILGLLKVTPPKMVQHGFYRKYKKKFFTSTYWRQEVILIHFLHKSFCKCSYFLTLLVNPLQFI